MDFGEPQQRGVADQVEERVHVLHLGQAMRESAARPEFAVRNLAAWGKRERLASWPPPRRTAAAACPCSAPGSTACCAPRPSWPAAPIGETTGDAARRDRLVRPRPARARRSRSRCSATPARPGTASTGSRRRPARCSASGLAEQRRPPRAPARRSPSSARTSSDLVGQIDRALPTEPDVAVILIGANDVTHSVLPVAVGAAPRPRPSAGCATPASRSSSAPAPTSARSSRSRRRSSRSARAWSRRLAAAQTIAVVEEGGRTVSLGSILGPGVRGRARRCCSGPTSSTRRPTATARWSTCCCPSTLAALGLAPEDEAEPEAYRGEGVLPVTTAARRRPSRRPAPSSTAPRSAASRRGVRGLLGRAAAPPADADRRHRGPRGRRGRGHPSGHRRCRGCRTRPRTRRGLDGSGVSDTGFIGSAGLAARLYLPSCCQPHRVGERPARAVSDAQAVPRLGTRPPPP